MLQSDEPIPIHGDTQLPKSRQVVWRNLCMIGSEPIECIVEFSILPNRFNIVCLDIDKVKSHVIQLYEKQARKVLKNCEDDMQKLMLLLDFNRHGNLCIPELEFYLSAETKKLNTIDAS
jgi:hypothetical protein